MLKYLSDKADIVCDSCGVMATMPLGAGLPPGWPSCGVGGYHACDKCAKRSPRWQMRERAKRQAERKAAAKAAMSRTAKKVSTKKGAKANPKACKGLIPRAPVFGGVCPVCYNVSAHAVSCPVRKYEERIAHLLQVLTRAGTCMAASLDTCKRPTVTMKIFEEITDVVCGQQQ